MPVRRVAAAAMVLVLAGCGSGPAGTGPGATSPPGSTGALPTGSGTAAAIDLSQVDVCAIVPGGTAERLTGETGFTADGSSSASEADCFWAVPRVGVPQYLEVTVMRRTASLEGYGISPDGNACPGASVAVAGAEAVGAICRDEQTKVWLAAMDQGVMVQVIVNEPKGTLTPASLAAAASGILAGLR